MAASHFKLDNLTVFLDRNHFCIDGDTEDVMALEPLAEKWKAFGWHVHDVDGHDLRQLAEAIELAQAHRGSPVMILARTIKGKGVDFMENDPAWHYGALNSDLIEKAKASIDRNGARRSELMKTGTGSAIGSTVAEAEPPFVAVPVSVFIQGA